LVWDLSQPTLPISHEEGNWSALRKPTTFGRATLFTYREVLLIRSENGTLYGVKGEGTCSDVYTIEVPTVVNRYGYTDIFERLDCIYTVGEHA
jgi:hypothetical protein